MPIWLNRKRADFRRSPRRMHRHPRECTRRRCASGIQPLSSSGIRAGDGEGSRGTTTRPAGRGGRERAFSGIAEALRNRSSGQISQSRHGRRYRRIGEKRGTRGVQGEEGEVEGACLSDCSDHTGTLEAHTDDSWSHATCLDTPGILMIPGRGGGRARAPHENLYRAGLVLVRPRSQLIINRMTKLAMNFIRPFSFEGDFWLNEQHFFTKFSSRRKKIDVKSQNIISKYNFGKRTLYPHKLVVLNLTQRAAKSQNLSYYFSNDTIA